MKDLRYFIRRATVLQQYRGFMRECRRLGKSDAQMGADIRQQVKDEFRKYKEETEKSLISVLLKQGSIQLDQLKELNDRRSGLSKPVEKGWKGTTDADGSDERGRVGEGWPWQN
mmetsp:Transcript_15409/g.29846  ORF Transcript_15409/g.29846 Transcript_15409/m.29846 type:complete len:114 (+) Transcript_15409:119-460(+)|eukprot:CAMPEP_0171528106 /NCGR_PEP_ID=MMETSP0959-20130129/11454_1 /TAXON_ID=87120 /ORGANISM="Aurantiochytrium limacinum, Strain ATCCMYA-1381" /LENGTH=113 /DNA_ID=CAMNT_0012069983 /DNA_START=95 /DNA_END=436 /DNA_ORIENTATION=+